MKEGKEKAVADLGKCWELKEVHSNVLLGMTIQQDTNTGAITILQRVYFECMLEHFGLQDVKPCHTPLPPGLKLKESPNPLPEVKHIYMADKPYHPIVGSVMWGSGCT